MLVREERTSEVQKMNQFERRYFYGKLDTLQSL